MLIILHEMHTVDCVCHLKNNIAKYSVSAKWDGNEDNILFSIYFSVFVNWLGASFVDVVSANRVSALAIDCSFSFVKIVYLVQ